MKRTILLFGVMALVLALLAGSHTALKTKAKEETRSPGTDLPNYDIRTDNGIEAADTLTRFRQSSNKDAVSVASVRDGFVAGEDVLRQKVPALKVEYNEDFRIPEVIGPDINQGDNFLTGKSTTGRSEILRSFIKENNSLLGVSNAQVDQLDLRADYANPDGNLSYIHLEQKINGIPVFRGEIKAVFTKQGEMARVINNLAPGLDYDSLSSNFRDPADAVRAAARNSNYELQSTDTTINAAASTDLKTVYGEGDWATTAEKMYFPTEPGIAVPAWRVIIWQPVDVYMVIVDAETGTMLWRKNATEGQTQSVTYNVYTNPNAMINVADSPAPLSPGPINPNFGTQGALKTRTNVTRVGNEAPYTFNNNGWVTDGNNTTDGNAVEAGIDRDTTNGVDFPQAGFPFRVFTSTWNPPPGNPAPGDDPLSLQAQRGSAIQMFYIMNLYHDELYRLGFTEPVGNFQQNNFGRGGVSGDRISAESQDRTPIPFSCPPCFNNANFATVPDGGRGRMQMYLWNGPTPDRDGAADAEVVIHEATHGTSNRLIGNASGLTTNMSRGLGEGWSDFFALAMLSQASDPINGVYAMGGYATYLRNPDYTSNYYYGIRRFPKAVMQSVGPNGLPHNPLTFRYVNSNCDILIGNEFISPHSAYPRNPAFAQPDGAGGPACDQVHNLGEIWSSALWEVRAKFIARLGWEKGNRKILELVTEGMNISAMSPTFLQARDAIIMAARFKGDLTDVADLWAGFSLRGLGTGASIQNVGTGHNDTAVTENFVAPQLTVSIAPSSLSFKATVGGTNPANKLLNISSLAAFHINWTASDNASWLSVTQNQASPWEAIVSVNSSGLAVGTYTANVKFDVPGASNSPVNVPVTLTVNPEPLSINPTSLNFSAIVGSSNPGNLLLNLKNSGTGPVNFSTTDDAIWLSISPATGSVASGATVNAPAAVNISGLSVGTYNGKISITDTGSGVKQDVPVTLTVKPVPPVISVNPNTLSFSAVMGGRNTFNVPLSITNSGAGTLKWTAVDDASWLSISPSGIAPSTATVTINSSNLGVGSYFGTITISAPGAATKTVPVELNVTNPTQ